ncbi:MAG: BamA/TamA family outer membrane protein [Campylobacterota bacterium]|nr:BamA/TamA family outer membrane protein [Campylobacterota bacterium]
MKQFLSFFLILSLLHAQKIPLTFEGNKEISDNSLYEALEIEVPLFFEFWKKKPSIDPKLRKLSVEYLKSYYKSKGYYHTIIESDENNGTRVTVKIEENRPITIVNIEMVSTLDISDIIPLQNGEIFDSQKFTQSKKRIKKFYVDRSFCNVDVDAKSWIDIEEDSAYILYTVTPNNSCKFGEVSISSPENIDADIIGSFLEFKENEKYSTELIRQSYDSLYSQEGIAKVLLDSNNKHDNVVPVQVSVEGHDRPIRLNTGLGYSSDEGFEVSMGVKHRNFLNNLKTLSLNGRYSEIKKSIASAFTMPFSNQNAFSAEIGHVDEKFIGYKERSTYQSLYFNQRNKPQSFVEGIMFDHAVTYDSQDDEIFKNSDLYIASLLLGWKYDIRDKLLEPTRGYFFKADVSGSINSFLSDATYLKYELNGGYIHSMGSSVLAARAKYGSIKIYDGNIPASYRFYAGGMNSNRAYNYRMLGPKNVNNDPIGFSSVTEGTLEYRFPISGNIRGVVFNDTTFIGNSYSADYDKAYISFGAGVRYVTPIGPIALDIGVDSSNINQYAIHFHIGELF